MSISFKVSDTGLALFLPALVDSDCIHCLINDTEATRMVGVFASSSFLIASSAEQGRPARVACVSLLTAYSAHFCW
jgi:hypothetical protein